jgi:1,2-dihydroxy-3-keto-5-methylthiopentene dioxygenase
MLEVSVGDYINVPANTEHWFTLGDSKRIKAVRYFIDTSGWTPVYTQRTMLFG